jgi:uncharacterized membrane protein
MRLLKHLFMPDWMAHRAYPKVILEKIEQAIRDSEQLHRGELRFAVEAGLPLHYLRKPVRVRAEDVFAQMRVWDTEENSGVLLYLQLVDRDIEIVADRGIGRKVAQPQWEAICRAMEEHFRAGRFEQGALEGIRRITTVLAEHFPPRRGNVDELSDKPIVL